MQADPRNFALILHSDGFQPSKTTQKNCGVVEIKVLNCGKKSNIGVFPVLFIPFRCKKIIGSSSKLFHVFLRPLMEELKNLFVQGIEIEYNYPISYIDGLDNSFSQRFVSQAMLMMVTGDHPAQCKIGCFKEGGKSFCRRDKAKATLEVEGSGRYLYDENRRQIKYPRPRRCGQKSNIGVFPVLFIPFRCKKIIGSSSKLFHVFLRPLMEELESLFVQGIEIEYNYPISYIDGLDNSFSQRFVSRALLMMVIGDHPARCKIGCFKRRWEIILS